MPETRSLCAQIPIDLHQRICEAREESGLTTAQYITNLLLEYYEMKENGGKVTMANSNSRTMAFQIPETLFLRIKAHLERESARTGKKLTQREFVLGLVVAALDEAERQAGVNGSGDEGVREAAADDSGAVENSELPGDAPSDDGFADVAPGFGVSDADMGHEGGAELNMTSDEGDADGGED